MFMYLYRASWHSSATLTEVFPCFFPSCKANVRVKPAKTGTARTFPNFLCCSMYCLFCVVLCILYVCVCVCVCVNVCKCVLYCCHRLATQLQLTNTRISHRIIVSKSGSLNLLEPSGPVQGCNGIALSFTSREKPLRRYSQDTRMGGHYSHSRCGGEGKCF